MATTTVNAIEVLEEEVRRLKAQLDDASAELEQYRIDLEVLQYARLDDEAEIQKLEDDLKLKTSQLDVAEAEREHYREELARVSTFQTQAETYLERRQNALKKYREEYERTHPNWQEEERTAGDGDEGYDEID